MLVFAPPVGSGLVGRGLVDTKLSVRLFCAGQTALVCSLSGKNLKSASPAARRQPASSPAAC